jgi:hypothetical protein
MTTMLRMEQRPATRAWRAAWTALFAIGLACATLLGPSAATAVEGGARVYIVQMSEDPIVAYDGGVPGYPAAKA